MGRINKTYMIVENDEYQFPVMMGISGAEECSRILGISLQSFRHRIMRDSWKGKYRAYIEED